MSTASPSWRPRTLAIAALLLFVATVASRLPFTSQMLYAWDSASFALALDRYNVAFHQPHPPGYPLYVAAAALIDGLLQDANASYVSISVAASGGAVAFLFLLATRMYGPMVGLAAAILLGATVGFWGYGEVTYPYTSLSLFGTLVALLCYLMWQGHRWPAVLTGLVLGLAMGVRQDTAVFLGPLWLASIWRVGIRRSLLGVLTAGLLVASWLLPAAWLSGGMATFLEASSMQSQLIMSRHSVFALGVDALRLNTETFLLSLKQMFGAGLLIAIYFAGRFLTFKATVADHRVPFLLLWILPPTLVYLLIHIGDPGYLLSIVPALCIVTAVGIRDIGRDLREALMLLPDRYPRLRPLAHRAEGAGSGLAVLLVACLVAWNANAFLTSPGPARLIEIRTIDTILANQIGHAREHDPNTVVVLAKNHFRQMKYYLPSYNVRLLYDEYQQGYLEASYSLQIPEGVTIVLVMDFGKRPSGFPEAEGDELTLADSPQVRLWRFDVKPGDTIQYGYDHFAVRRLPVISIQPSAGNGPQPPLAARS